MAPTMGHSIAGSGLPWRRRLERATAAGAARFTSWTQRASVSLAAHTTDSCRTRPTDAIRATPRTTSFAEGGAGRGCGAAGSPAWLAFPGAETRALKTPPTQRAASKSETSSRHSPFIIAENMSVGAA